MRLLATEGLVVRVEAVKRLLLSCSFILIIFPVPSDVINIILNNESKFKSLHCDNFVLTYVGKFLGLFY
jgi:hypothetical protein